MALVFDNKQNIVNENNEILARTSLEINEINNFDILKNMINSGNFDIEFCEDGTVIRVYYNTQLNNWTTATNKCINACSAYWGGDKSFNELFLDVFDLKNFDKMDKNFTYFFVLTHVDNRIVLKHTKSSVMFIYRIDNETGAVDYHLEFDCNRPTKLENFEYSNSKRGLMLTPKNVNEERVQCKFDYFEYRNMRLIRGNTPTIRERFIEVLKDYNTKMAMYAYYPEYNLMFKLIESEFIKLVESLYNAYYNSHVYKLEKFSPEEAEEGSQLFYFYKTIKNIHYTYKTHNKPITHDVVRNILFELPSNIIIKLFNWL